MLRAIKRAFTESIKGMTKNGLMTMTSLFVVTACIFVFGIFLMCIFNINDMTAKMADDYQVDVYIERETKIDDDTISVFIKRGEGVEDETYQTMLSSLSTRIMGTENVDVSSVNFYSGAQRFADFKANLTEAELVGFSDISDNAIDDSYTLKLNDKSQKAQTIMKLSEIDTVNLVLDATEVYAKIANLGSLSTKVSSAKYEEMKENLKANLLSLENISPEIEFVDGIKKFEDFKNSLTVEEKKGYLGLPDDLMPDAFTVRLKDLSLAEETISEIKKFENVESVENNRELVNIIDSLKDSVQKVSVWIIVVFLIVSLFRISNTIKLTVHNRRKEINIMKYVGATDSYIRGPFIMEGILLGIISALLAYFISQWSYQGLISAVNSNISSILSTGDGLMPFGKIWSKLLVSYSALGVFIGAFGSSISVRRYLHV